MVILNERIKTLRKERNWSQAELAEKIGADGRQISRYENGKITPSVETIVKIAQIFDVSTDYLLKENSPKKSFVFENKDLQKLIESFQKISDEDKKCLTYIIDSFMTKNKIKSFAQEIN